MTKNAPLSPYKSIFRAGSKTYFYSSFFFDGPTREQVSRLYAFVRLADNYVDATPQDSIGFFNFRSKFTSLFAETIPLEVTSITSVPETIIASFVELMREKSFELAWVEAFLDAMQADLTKSRYQTIAETESYMYGSAEVVGLMMARIMNLPDEALWQARMLGRSMQYINFIRDIDEDNQLGRVYLPQEELQKHGLTDLTRSRALSQKPEFHAFIAEQVDRYLAWLEIAETGYAYIPNRYLIPIKTASDMYRWTALEIRKRPETVFERKLKPSVGRIFGFAGRELLKSFFIPLKGRNDQAPIVPDSKVP